jgi:serine/threonine-protein kinase HipA
MVFNILVSNDDDHLRNHGFVWDPCISGWRLSPLYDVLPRASIASERFLHLAIGNQGRLATIDNALSAAGSFMLPQKKACECISEVWRVTRQWKTYFDEFKVSAAEIEKISPAFRHIDDVSSPALRALLP